MPGWNRVRTGDGQVGWVEHDAHEVLIDQSRLGRENLALEPLHERQIIGDAAPTLETESTDPWCAAITEQLAALFDKDPRARARFGGLKKAS